MRLFIGSFASIRGYGEIRKEFSFLRGKWVEPANLHLTYLFLGEVAVPQSIIYRLSQLRYEPKEFTITGLGSFGGRILFARLDPKPLLPIYRQICELLDQRPDKPFRPHVTFCRIKDIGDRRRFEDLIGRYADTPLGSLEPKIHLIESRLTPKGPIYRPIHTFTGG